MVETGRSFMTLIPKPTDVSIRPSSRPLLPHRHNDFVFGHLDFKEYELQREIFFSNYQHLRAALLAGGIIWRIALEELGIDPALWGPSETTNYAFELVLNNQSFVDDGLSSEEMDFICGVYYVYTGTCSKTGDSLKTDLSWFPKQSAWTRNGGRHVGCWTKECEAWYLDRLDLAKKGLVQPRSGREWARSLRSSHQSGKFHAVYSAAAAKYLEGELS
jgi:hypothetical protein